MSRSAIRRRKSNTISLEDHGDQADLQAKDPSEAAQSRKGRVTLKAFTWVVILVLIVTAVEIFILTR